MIYDIQAGKGFQDSGHVLYQSNEIKDFEVCLMRFLRELVRLRVKDIGFENVLLFVREGKGEKDRTTLLPKGIHAELKEHLEIVKTTHRKDLVAGLGDVYMPHADRPLDTLMRRGRKP